jgi:hypothetical protein
MKSSARYFCKHYEWIDISDLKKWKEQLIKTHYCVHLMVQVYDKGKNTNMIW